MAPSYDSGYTVAVGSFLPVHQISPAIDLERDYVVASLSQARVVADTTRLQFVLPKMGTNAFGERFFTYGQAVIVGLSNAPMPVYHSQEPRSSRGHSMIQRNWLRMTR